MFYTYFIMKIMYVYLIWTIEIKQVELQLKLVFAKDILTSNDIRMWSL